MKRYYKWICLIILSVCVFVAPFLVQQRYTGILTGGQEYQLPVSLQRVDSWVPSDYLTVRFLGCQAPWTGETPPVIDSEMYVVVQPQQTGLLKIVRAQQAKPDQGLYILSKATAYANGLVEFTLPFDRVKVNINKVNPAFYQNYKGLLLATIKLKDGRGVITGVYSKGIPIESAVPETMEQQVEDSRIPISDIGSTQPIVTVTPNSGAGQTSSVTNP